MLSLAYQSRERHPADRPVVCTVDRSVSLQLNVGPQEAPSLHTESHGITASLLIFIRSLPSARSNIYLMDPQRPPRKRMKSGITRVRTGCYTCRRRKVKVGTQPLVDRHRYSPSIADSLIFIHSVTKRSQNVVPAASLAFVVRATHCGTSSAIHKHPKPPSGQRRQRLRQREALNPSNHRPLHS